MIKSPFGFLRLFYEPILSHFPFRVNDRAKKRFSDFWGNAGLCPDLPRKLFEKSFLGTFKNFCKRESLFLMVPLAAVH